MRFAFLLSCVLCAATADAVAGEQNPSPPVQPSSTPDFLFGRPNGSVGIRAGWLFARAGSEWYDFVTRPDQLTIDRSDFNAPGIAGDVGLAISPRLDVVIDIEFNRRSIDSEYRQLVDNNRQPITQTTAFSQVNMMGGLKFALTERGREISQLAWIPHKVVPYVGAGGGVLWYKLQQTGDFVDVLDPRTGAAQDCRVAACSIFSDVFQSTGWTPAAQLFGGVEIKLTRRLYATFDARYLWAAAKMGRQFVSFDKLDLAGLRTSAGVNVLF